MLFTAREEKERADNAARQQKFRDSVKEHSRKEVRGLHVPEYWHDEFKAELRKKIAQLEKKFNCINFK